MAAYYKNCPSTAPSANAPSAASTSTSAPGHAMSEFDKHHERLLSDDLEEGWASELCHYLNMMQWDIQKDTDIVEWWQVHTVICLYPSSTNPSSVGPCPIISYTCMDCAWCPLISSFVCAMWTVVFRYQADCKWLPIMAGFQTLRRTCDHGICVGTWALQFRCLKCSWNWGGYAQLLGNASWWCWRFRVGKGVGFQQLWAWTVVL